MGELVNINENDEYDIGVINGNFAVLAQHGNDTGNPHGVTAAQTGAYTREEVDEALSEKASNDSHTSHTGNTTVHITAAERTSWNGKASSFDLTSHTGDTTAHITAAERTSWNGKASTGVATTSANGLMSTSDKSKLDGMSGYKLYQHRVKIVSGGAVFFVVVFNNSATSFTYSSLAAYLYNFGATEMAAAYTFASGYVGDGYSYLSIGVWSDGNSIGVKNAGRTAYTTGFSSSATTVTDTVTRLV